MANSIQGQGAPLCIISTKAHNINKTIIVLGKYKVAHEFYSLVIYLG